MNKGVSHIIEMIGVGVTIGIAIVGYVVSSDKAIEENVKANQEEISQKGERIASVEATVIGVDGRLKRIEDKLDLILQKK